MSIGRCILLLALVFPLGVVAETYRYVDQNGVVHYTDRPVEGAELVQLSGAQTFNDRSRRRPLSSVPRATPPAPQQSAPAAATTEYESMQIIQPAHDTTLWNSAGRVEITYNVQPALRAGHRVRLFLDGEPVPGEDDRALSVVLQNVDRGTHEIRAIVEDINGNALVRSDVTTFHYRQTFIRRN